MPSVAETQGLERVSMYPKSTKYGRQNPATARRNSEEQLILWRAAWADTVNGCLERSGHEERVDHRSHAERGLDEQPTILNQLDCTGNHGVVRWNSALHLWNLCSKS